MSYRKSMPLLLAFLAAATLLSCGREGKVLARVGDQQITVAEFEDVYRPMPGLADSSAVQENKARVLDQLVEQRLLVLAALERGAGNDQQVAERFEDMKKNVLLQQLYKVEILDKAKPTESEIRSFHKKLGTEVKASHILVKTEAEAKDVIVKLKSGASFSDLARQHSQDPGSAQQGGSLGWFGWGRMVDEFQRAAFALKPGQVSDPVETGFGFHVIRLDSTRQAEHQDLDQMRERITQQLTQSKPRELTTKYLKALRKQAGIKIQDNTLAAIASKQQPAAPGMPPTLPELSPEEMKGVLVKYSGGSWTVAEFFDQARKLLNGMVDLNNRPMVEKQIEALLSNEFLLRRAKARGLDRQPQVKRQMERAWNDLLAGSVYRDEVQPKTEVGEEEAKAHYQKNRKDYYQNPRALIHIIVVKTKPEAEEVYGLLGRGADFATLARERSIDWTKSTGGALQMTNPRDPDNPEAASRAFSMPLNQLSRPFACRDGFAVMKVTQREPGLQRTYDQARLDIISSLRQAREEAVFQELIAGLRQKYTVTVDQALLAKAGNEKK